MCIPMLTLLKKNISFFKKFLTRLSACLNCTELSKINSWELTDTRKKGLNCSPEFILKVLLHCYYVSALAPTVTVQKLFLTFINFKSSFKRFFSPQQCLFWDMHTCMCLRKKAVTLVPEVYERPWEYRDMKVLCNRWDICKVSVLFCFCWLYFSLWSTWI